MPEELMLVGLAFISGFCGGLVVYDWYLDWYGRPRK